LLIRAYGEFPANTWLLKSVQSALKVATVMEIFLLAIFAAFATPPPGGQQGRSCKENPELVGQCFKVHGRVRIGNGTPQMRIWRIGTDRVMGVLPSEDEIIPENLRDAFQGDFYKDVYGDFEVCPFTKRKPEEMQMVCVESASHLVIKKTSN
jgi:hypothetical protein